jgi:hypothetical protein
MFTHRINQSLFLHREIAGYPEDQGCSSDLNSAGRGVEGGDAVSRPVIYSLRRISRDIVRIYTLRCWYQRS